MVIEEYRSHEEHYQRQMLKLQNDNQMLHGEIQRLRDNEDLTVRKYQEYDIQITNFRSSISQYENKIRDKDTIIEDLNFKISDIQQQLSKSRSQINWLNQEIERINDNANKKYVFKYYRIS